MQKLSFNKKQKLPDLEDGRNEIRFNKLKNVKRLSGEIKRKNFVRFRSNSSFDLIIDDKNDESSIKDNNEKAKKDENNDLIKMNRPVSVPLGIEKKQIRFTSSIFKPISLASSELEEKRKSSVDIKESTDEKNMSDSRRNSRISQNYQNDQNSKTKKSNIPLARIRLPPVELKMKKSELNKAKKLDDQRSVFLTFYKYIKFTLFF